MDRSRRKICTLFSNRFGVSGSVALVIGSSVVGDVSGNADEISSAAEHLLLPLPNDDDMELPNEFLRFNLGVIRLVVVDDGVEFRSNDLGDDNMSDLNRNVLLGVKT